MCAAFVWIDLDDRLFVNFHFKAEILSLNHVIQFILPSNSYLPFFSPEFTAPVVSLSNKTIHESQTNKTILRCAIASGYPKPNITWYKDGVKLTLYALGPKDDCRINGYHYMEKYGHPATEYLVICKPSHVQNTGLYICVAENLVKKAWSEGFLNVLGSCCRLSTCHQFKSTLMASSGLKATGEIMTPFRSEFSSIFEGTDTFR